MAEFNFPSQLESKIRRASRNIIISQAQSVIFSLRDELNKTNDFSESKNASLKGVKVFDNIILSPTDKPTNYYNESGVEETLLPIHLDVATINLSGSTRIIETNILNQRGSIKEVVGENEYKITISGVLVGSISNVIESIPKPKALIKNLIKHCESKVPITVESEYLNYVGVTHIVIKSFNFPQNLDSMNLQSFTLNCVSDNQNLTI